MNNYYTVWDNDNSRLGFAVKDGGYDVEPITAGTAPNKVLRG